ncbi:hypothetical protein GCM10022403_078740 [Streptomyces coacervatus]|uniref:NACHT domain-containing protein n=1 Tax=Streptomyces coacervatus TaxID=647381 RepID=A0ABP7J588_9ACTN|nr:hypothetical protein [Streptomyces coacervatus]MDF2269268.1 hypothetical protein [Streptomyces coacervatus]
MSAENTHEPQSAVERLGACLKSLYDEAQKARPASVTYRRMAEEFELPRGTLGGWLHGVYAPSEDKLCKYRALIAYLEERAGRSPVRTGGWDRLIASAMAESDSKQRVGRPPKTSRPRRMAPFRFSHTAEMYRPQELTGREAESEQLQALIRKEETGYLALVAPPWAGKTAFLATFATNHAAEDIDLIAYFVRWRHGTDNARAFTKVMVSKLNEHIGGKPVRADTATLLALYEEAARKSAGRGRILLLIIDGLDEDAEAGIGREPSIASLLPPQLYPGLRVLVSRRWHPPLPGDVPGHHPLRRATQIPGFQPSPQADVLRSIALDDLAELFRDSRAWVHEIIGLLALANGGLSHRDLVDLVRIGGHAHAPIRFNLEDLLRSVAGRVLGPEDLEPDTFVLAHEALYRTVTDELGPEILTPLAQRLHTWADSYRADGWPESTPVYLLHHYPEFLKETGELDRWAHFALDHRRLLRLAERGRPDVALASLDHVTQVTPTPSVLAAAAASRSLLSPRNPLVPREVLRMLCLVGDVTRARALALAPTDAASKAVRLLEVVKGFKTMKTQKAADQAADLAREAAVWAQRAWQQNLVTMPSAEPDTEAVVSRTAVALAATGQPVPAIHMLRTVDICRPEHVSSAAEVAALLGESAPEFAAWLLDELTSEAEYQAESGEGSPAFAMHIWAAVAGADPGRAESARRKIRELSREPGEESASPEASDGSALPGPGLPEAFPADASAAEAGNALLDELHGTPTGVEQELLAVGEAPEKIRTLLTEANEREQLIRDMERLSAVGDSAQLHSCLDQFMKATARRSPATDWLPFLSQALADACNDVDTNLLSRLRGMLPDTDMHIRVLTSAALVHADAGQHDEALRCAALAAEMAEPMTAPGPPETLTIAQVFAHLGDAEQAAQWASPPHGRRPIGKAGICYRRTALAVEMGLAPNATMTRILNNNPSLIGFSAAGKELLAALSRIVAGAHTDAQITSLKGIARARLDTEPLIATGLSLLYAVHGDTERAADLTAALPDAAARGVAQATLAGYLAGIPAYLDVTADEDLWTLSVLRVLAHHAHPSGPGHDATVQTLVNEALGTSSWYWALPVLSREIPETLHRIVNILDQHHQARQLRW